MRAQLTTHGWNCSPHLRGWSLPTVGVIEERSLFPAPAGMVPMSGRNEPTWMAVPRTCGDGPGSEHCLRPVTSCSPHLRGWSSLFGLDEVSAILFPAPAGMVPCGTEEKRAEHPVPRTCGDGPSGSNGSGIRIFCSPHLRGWSYARVVLHWIVELFPAPAGMVPGDPVRTGPPSSVPRTCGDGPALPSLLLRTASCSPHLRGWSRGGIARDRDRLLFPAPAGMVPATPARRPSAPAVPRTCGDGPRTISKYPATPTCSPHLRGWSQGKQ